MRSKRRSPRATPPPSSPSGGIDPSVLHLSDLGEDLLSTVVGKLGGWLRSCPAAAVNKTWSRLIVQEGQRRKGALNEVSWQYFGDCFDERVALTAGASERARQIPTLKRQWYLDLCKVVAIPPEAGVLELTRHTFPTLFRADRDRISVVVDMSVVWDVLLLSWPFDQDAKLRKVPLKQLFPCFVAAERCVGSLARRVLYGNDFSPTIGPYDYPRETGEQFVGTKEQVYRFVCAVQDSLANPERDSKPLACPVGYVFVYHPRSDPSEP